VRFTSWNLKADLVSLPYIRYLYTNDRFQQIRTALTSTVAPVNTDALPICYQYTLMIWLSKFFPDLATLNLSPLSEFFGKAGILWHPAWLALPIVFWMCRRWGLCRASLLAGIAGFAGMVLETVLLLRFQTKNGALFEDLGVLLMAFMAGLAVGAAGITRLSRMYLSSAVFVKLAGGVLTGAFLLQSLLLGQTECPGLGGLVGVSTALFLTGVLVSGLFAVASLQTASAVHEQKSRAVGPLYAADLFGGCLGSLLSSLVLIPFAGLATTAKLLVPLLLSAVALLL
jgi:hypothetical protein